MLQNLFQIILRNTGVWSGFLLFSSILGHRTMVKWAQEALWKGSWDVVIANYQLLINIGVGSSQKQETHETRKASQSEGRKETPCQNTFPQCREDHQWLAWLCLLSSVRVAHEDSATSSPSAQGAGIPSCPQAGSCSLSLQNYFRRDVVLTAGLTTVL